MSQLINIEVVYYYQQTLTHLQLAVPTGCTAAQALHYAAIAQRCPQLQLSTQRLAIFGRRIDAHTPLQHGDRLEICRILAINAKDKRRQRALQATVKAKRHTRQ